MTKPIRIQRKRTKGWRMPENTVYVGRPSNWRNIYRISEVWPDASDVVRMFERDLLEHPAKVAAVKRNLKGKDLACWCPLDRPCHADVLLRVANE